MACISNCCECGFPVEAGDSCMCMLIDADWEPEEEDEDEEGEASIRDLALRFVNFLDSGETIGTLDAAALIAFAQLTADRMAGAA